VIVGVRELVGVIVLVGDILAVKVGNGVLDDVGVKVREAVAVEVIVEVFVGGIPMIANLPEVFHVVPTKS